MDPIVFVEVLDHRGRVRSRHRASHLPVRIGRSYSNDVILDDVWVSPHHAEIQESVGGGLLISDRGSENGTFLHRSRERISRAEIGTGDRVRIGRTTLRICTPDTAIAPTATESALWFKRGHFIEQPAVAAAVAAGVVGMFAVADTVATTEVPFGANLLLVTLVAGLMLAIWAGAWALGARLRGRQPRFLQHAAWMSIIAGVIWIETVLFDYTSMIAPRMDWLVVLEGLLDVALGVVLIVGHLTLASTLAMKTRVIIAGSIGVAVLALGALASGIDEGVVLDELVVSRTLRPVPSRLLVTSTPEAFFADTRDLIEKLQGATGPVEATDVVDPARTDP